MAFFLVGSISEPVVKKFSKPHRRNLQQATPVTVMQGVPQGTVLGPE